MVVSFSYGGDIHRPLAKQLADELTGSGVLGCINQLVVYASGKSAKYLELENKHVDEAESGMELYAVAYAYDDDEESKNYYLAYLVGTEQEAYASFSISASKNEDDIARFEVGLGLEYVCEDC